jgi:ArsR family metal-binding transcriptional regulator
MFTKIYKWITTLVVTDKLQVRIVFNRDEGKELGGNLRNFANLQIVNETANTMLQQCRLSWF